MGQPEEAIAHFTRALQLRPDNAEMHNTLGVILNSVGQHEEAIASYRAALKVNPDLPEAFNNLCELFEKANRMDELKRAVSQAQAKSAAA